MTVPAHCLTRALTAALILAGALLAVLPGRSRPQQRAQIIRLDARFDRLVPHEAKLEKIADGFTWVEGPVWHRAGAYLLFSDIPRNAVMKWEPGAGASVFLEPSGYSGTAPFAGPEPGSNGLALDHQGRLLLAQHGDRRIARLERDGRLTVLAHSYQGQRLNSPNDLVLDSKGNIYFTDPPFGLPQAFDDPAKELPFQGVYRLSPDGDPSAALGTRLRLLTREFLAPNGIALAPDERTLYITDVHPRRAAWYAYDLQPDGSITRGRVFHDAGPWKQPPFFGPDGLKVDYRGNLFAARHQRVCAGRHFAGQHRDGHAHFKLRLGRGRLGAIHHRRHNGVSHSLDHTRGWILMPGASQRTSGR